MATATVEHTKKAPAKAREKTAAAVFGGQVVVPAKCKPSKCCSTDRTRPVLCNAYITVRDDGPWLLATNSYCLAAVKLVVTEGTVQEGFVPIGALRLMERGQKAEQVNDRAWKVWTREGTITFDVGDDLKGAIHFPDFDKLAVWGETEKRTGEPFDTANVAMGLNPDFMHAVALAIGGSVYGVRIEAYSPLRPYRVLPLGGSTATDRIGIVMPIRLNV